MNMIEKFGLYFILLGLNTDYVGDIIVTAVVLAVVLFGGILFFGGKKIKRRLNERNKV